MSIYISKNVLGNDQQNYLFAIHTLHPSHDTLNNSMVSFSPNQDFVDHVANKYYVGVSAFVKVQLKV